MDFQAFVDGFCSLTSVFSVERRGDGYGDIRLVAANQRYFDAFQNPTVLDMPEIFHTEFVPNSLYTNYRPRDLNFEYLCYRSAVLKKPIHTYVHPAKSRFWYNIFVMPVDFEEGNTCYCTYTLEPCAASEIGLKSSQFVETSANVLRTCIKLHDTADMKKTMNEVIKDIREICNAEVCTIMLIDSATETFSIMAKNVRENSTLKTVTQFVNFYDIATSWIKMIGEEGCLVIKNEQDMQYVKEANNPWYLTLEEAGVKSVVLFPLRFHQETLGFIWATNFDIRNTLQIKETLELTTFFISSQIANYNMIKRLERISYTDLLTGVNNRNAMNSRVTGIIEGTEHIAFPFGVVFADLNGLKTVNDCCGHSAGDLLLRKAAILLQEIFIGDEIFRAGGDEFMILISGCTENDFLHKVEILQKRANNPNNVCFAIGSYFTGSACDIRDAMHQADENMYINKKLYYTIHPERKLR